ncbi:MAG: efflux RND transporter permease subunit [Oscillochloris sp.]|nr:efflux RND transporter permease subunit [Oscillochloris sp.]
MHRHRLTRTLSGMKISDTAIKQPVLIVMIMVLLLVLGILGYRSMAVNRLPDFDLGTITVSVIYAGAGPQSVAEQGGQTH